MYTIQYLFRKHHMAPNKIYSTVYFFISLVLSIYSGINYWINFSAKQGLIAGSAVFTVSLLYFLNSRFWGIDKRINDYLAREGLSQVSMYALESAANTNNIFVDTISDDTDFNQRVIYLSYLPMDHIEGKCEAKLIGEFFCNITKEQSSNYILRRLAMGKVVTVAFDRYPVDKALDEADCVLVPNGTDSQGSPACVYYDNQRFNSAAEACKIYINSARHLTEAMDAFYCGLALRCLLFQFILGILTFMAFPLTTMGPIAAILILILLGLNFLSLKAVFQQV